MPARASAAFASGRGTVPSISKFPTTAACRARSSRATASPACASGYKRCGARCSSSLRERRCASTPACRCLAERHGDPSPPDRRSDPRAPRHPRAARVIRPGRGGRGGQRRRSGGRTRPRPFARRHAHVHEDDVGRMGAEATRALADAGIEVPVIILTTFDDHHQVLAGIQAGARGYLLKDVSLESLIEAIESVATGKTMIQPGVTESLLRGLTGRTLPDAAAPPERLTPRETEILRLMAGGYSNREIATALSRSEGTIKNQVSSILGKLGVRDRTRAVLKAIEMGLLADAT